MYSQHIKQILIANASLIQGLLFISTMTVLWLIEKYISAEPTQDKWRHTSINIFLMSFALPLQFIAGFILILITTWVAAHHWGIIYLLPHPANPWVKYALMFIMLDFLDYVYHSVMHRVPLFWRFHLVHHTDNRIDVSTTLREHPGETILRNCFLMCWVMLCGASFGVLILRQTVQTLFNISSHSSFRLPALFARILGLVFITPNLHHVHHHRERPYTDSNYGDIFSVWDRLLGTFTELSIKDTIFGLDTHPSKALGWRYIDVVLIPFRKKSSWVEGS
jgi:sterol desaturase/sphingolipid hydroxylase (fatty acid hydroxylase superfamily)